MAKPRKPNFSEEEMLVLVEEIEKNYSVIVGKFSPVLTHERKTRVWAEITQRVNVVSFKTQRTVDEIKKKWQDAQSLVKKKEGERRKLSGRTGGGPPPETYFKPWEKVILRFLSPVAISGLDEGVDTSSCSNASTDSSHLFPVPSMSVASSVSAAPSMPAPPPRQLATESSTYAAQSTSSAPPRYTAPSMPAPPPRQLATESSTYAAQSTSSAPPRSTAPSMPAPPPRQLATESSTYAAQSTSSAPPRSTAPSMPAPSSASAAPSASVSLSTSATPSTLMDSSETEESQDIEDESNTRSRGRVSKKRRDESDMVERLVFYEKEKLKIKRQRLELEREKLSTIKEIHNTLKQFLLCNPAFAEC